MGTKRALAERLRGLAGFSDPDVALEQYPTPPDLAAHVVHLAALQGDVEGRTVVDLGAGTGVLALAAACRSPARVVGLERDPDAVAVARENESRVAPSAAVNWLLADATRPPLCLDADVANGTAADGADGTDDDAGDVGVDAGDTAKDGAGRTTALLNPPFGARTGNEGVDRAFLRAAASLSDVSYSVHNAGSREFVEAFAADEGGAVTHAFRADFEVARLYEHHTADRREIEVELFRIEWK